MAGFDRICKAEGETTRKVGVERLRPVSDCLSRVAAENSAPDVDELRPALPQPEEEDPSFRSRRLRKKRPTIYHSA